jgi:hypothetical protein
MQVGIISDASAINSFSSAASSISMSPLSRNNGAIRMPARSCSISGFHERDCHPDSIAEAFRRRITVLELQQIIGRGLRSRN